MYLVKNFCFYLSLRTGAIVIGIISLVEDLAWFLIAALLFTSANRLEYRSTEISSDIDMYRITGHRINASFATTIAATGMFILIFFVLAINKNRASFLVSFLVWSAATTVCTAAIMIWLLIIQGGWELSISIPWMSFQVYRWLVILSYYYELKDKAVVRKRSKIFTIGN